MGKIHFHRNTDVTFIASQLAKVINQKLGEGREVVWLVSGGSAIDVACRVVKHLDPAGLADLTVGLIDERYGQPGHPDSNWQHLLDAGFKLPGAVLEPVLIGLDLKQTADEYNRFIRQISRQNSYKIGLLGLGADGHTAGILPNSPAVDSKKYVYMYKGPDYKRVTLTGKGLSILDKAVIYAAGFAKKAAVKKLTEDIPPESHPAQLLKAVPAVDVYNDVIGDYK